MRVSVFRIVMGGGFVAMFTRSFFGIVMVQVH